jgi:hypothetical protein
MKNKSRANKPAQNKPDQASAKAKKPEAATLGKPFVKEVLHRDANGKLVRFEHVEYPDGLQVLNLKD